MISAGDVETDVQQIRIVIEGRVGHVPTALVVLDLDDAFLICDKLNRRLGYDRGAWTAVAAACMRADDDDPDGGLRYRKCAVPSVARSVCDGTVTRRFSNLLKLRIKKLDVPPPVVRIYNKLCDSR